MRGDKYKVVLNIKLEKYQILPLPMPTPSRYAKH